MRYNIVKENNAMQRHRAYRLCWPSHAPLPSGPHRVSDPRQHVHVTPQVPTVPRAFSAAPTAGKISSSAHAPRPELYPRTGGPHLPLSPPVTHITASRRRWPRGARAASNGQNPAHLATTQLHPTPTRGSHLGRPHVSSRAARRQASLTSCTGSAPVRGNGVIKRR
jgi:hypothetical protein